MTTGKRNRISIAILALGGQGGGVLLDWILRTAEDAGYQTQGTSVAGVAQRTGTTIYYIEMYPRSDRPAVLALSPVPGDVDVVIASELMEAGRAMVRGLVTKDRTTLIASTNRVYAIGEKIALGNGTANSDLIVQRAQERAKQFIGFNMDAVAEKAGSVVSSVMFGALAASGTLPFDRARFEETIRHSGVAVEASLAAFAGGYDAGRAGLTLDAKPTTEVPVPTTVAGRRLAERVASELPKSAHLNALLGVQRLMDYQGEWYAECFIDRLVLISAADQSLAEEAARALALWMSYEDVIRVADLKTRGTRFERVRQEVKATATEVLAITEFMHPRLKEICETLPTGIGKAILSSPRLIKLLDPLFRKGRFVQTTTLRWYIVLRALAGLRRYRRWTLRFSEEQERIDHWLKKVIDAAARNVSTAKELIGCQRLLKGYGDTFERGLNSYSAILTAYEKNRARDDIDQLLGSWVNAALADDRGETLKNALAKSA